MGSGHLRVFLHDYGGYAFTAQLGRALAGRGHQVNYTYSLTTQMMQRFSQRPEIDTFTVEGVRLPHSFNRYNYLRRRRDEREHGHRVVQQVRAFHPDVVLSANTPLDAQKLIQRACREVGAKFIFWMQDVIGLATKNALSSSIPIMGSIIGDHYLRLEKSLLQTSDGVVVISADFLDYLQGWGIDTGLTHVIPNWAPLEEIPVLPRDNSWSCEHGLSDRFVFLYTGVLGLKHDPRMFLSLAESFNQQPDVRVVVVSEGFFADELILEMKSKGLDNLILLPYQPAMAYAEMLASADVLMTILKPDASVYSVPSKVYAYMCAARPQLISISAGNPAAKLVTENQMGPVSGPGDMDAWVGNAHALYQNRYNNYQMGLNARAYAEAHFDIQRITDEFEAILNNAVKRS